MKTDNLGAAPRLRRDPQAVLQLLKTAASTARANFLQAKPLFNQSNQCTGHRAFKPVLPKPRAAKKPFLTWHKRPDDRQHGGGGTEKAAGGLVGALLRPQAARPLRLQHTGPRPPPPTSTASVSSELVTTQ